MSRCLAALCAVAAPLMPAEELSPTRQTTAVWRTEHRLIDVHQHVGSREDWLRRDIRIMDAAGIGVVVNLSGGYTTHTGSDPSEFEKTKALADRLFPGRFVHYMNLDYQGWDAEDFSARAVKQVEEGYRLGAAGLKEYKRLGLFLRNGAGKLIAIDDPKLDPVWKRCGELGMPVSIHVADPRAFWLPRNESNERWKELKDHPDWWFGDPAKYPPREDLLAALDRVIGRHRTTTFVAVHFANNAEDLDWVEKALDRNPNMLADLAARVPELGRHDPSRTRALFLKYQDRILFATDFQVYDELTLGSGGSGPPPTDADAEEFFAKHWRWLETDDRQFAHMTPIQGDWRIDAIGLPTGVLRKIYFENARRLLVRSLPVPVATARHIAADFALDGDLTKAVWSAAPACRFDSLLLDGAARPELTTEARLLWSDTYLYLGFRAPFTGLTVFEEPSPTSERMGLWERDVVETFIGPDARRLNPYFEFEVAPIGEKLDVRVDLPAKDFAWTSGFESSVKVDTQKKVWTTEMRIPLAALSQTKPASGDRWRLNLYRHDVANHAFLAWSPTGTSSAHTPERFGYLLFGE